MSDTPGYEVFDAMLRYMERATTTAQILPCLMQALVEIYGEDAVIDALNKRNNNL